MGGSYEEQDLVRDKQGEVQQRQVGASASPSAKDQESSALRAPRAAYTIEDFDIEKVLGSGSFAEVVQAKLKKTGKSYALKMMDKRHVIKEGKAEYILRERKALNALRNEGIVNLCFTFQDRCSLFLGMELCPGGELFDQIQTRKRLPVDDVKFYAAEVVLTLEFLHNCGIVHRDLKPENLLLTESGHLKLADFGSIKLLQPIENIENGVPISAENPPVEPGDKGRKTSFVGTAEYASPEVLNGGEASPAMDLWAIGCLVYQMFVGQPPFRGGTEYLTFQKIQQMDYTIPGVGILPLDAADLVKALLVEDPTQRLGMGARGMAEIKEHKFFSGIDWDGIRVQDAPQYVTPEPVDDEEVDDFLDIIPTEPTHMDAVRNLDQSDLWTDEDRKEVAGVAGVADGDVDNAEGDPAVLRLLDEGEHIVMMGTVKKYKSVFYRTRLLVLTDRPRLFYLDPSTMEVKGEIRLDKAEVRMRSKSTFAVKNADKTYFIEDISTKAKEWVEAIAENIIFANSRRVK